MDFNALQRDLMDADAATAAAKKKSRRSSSSIAGSGNERFAERDVPLVRDVYCFLEELGHGAYGSVMKARKRTKEEQRQRKEAKDAAHMLRHNSNSNSLLLVDASPVSSPSTPIPMDPSSYYAVKIIDKKKAGSKGLSEVMGEVETMRLLNHPNIVRLEATFEEDDCLYIVMEYMPGGELHQVMKRMGPLPEATARKLIIQLLLAVEYIHQRGIVHRDLKPANMLLRDEQEWQIKLADFGFSVLVGVENCLTSYCGTGAYMAPEIVLDIPYGKAVDIWAVGVILYVMIAGDYPFAASGGQDLAASIVTNKWQKSMNPRIADASPGARDFLTKLLTTDASRRPTAKDALKHTWVQAALQGLSVRVEANAVGRSGVEVSREVHPRLRFRSWVHVIVASHRLVYWRKLRALRMNQADIQPLRSFAYLVRGKYEPLHPKGVINVAGMLAHNPKAISHYLLPLVETSTTIETLDVSDNNIDSVDTVLAIVKSLANHPSLMHINLENNPISALAGRSLARLARAPNRIRTIKLGGTLVGSDVLQQVAAALKEKRGGGGGGGASGDGLSVPIQGPSPPSPIPPSVTSIGSSSSLRSNPNNSTSLHSASTHHHVTASSTQHPLSTSNNMASPPSSSRSSSNTFGSGSGGGVQRGSAGVQSTALLSHTALSGSGGGAGATMFVPGATPSSGSGSRAKVTSGASSQQSRLPPIASVNPGGAHLVPTIRKVR